MAQQPKPDPIPPYQRPQPGDPKPTNPRPPNQPPK